MTRQLAWPIGLASVRGLLLLLAMNTHPLFLPSWYLLAVLLTITGLTLAMPPKFWFRVWGFFSTTIRKTL